MKRLVAALVSLALLGAACGSKEPLSDFAAPPPDGGAHLDGAGAEAFPPSTTTVYTVQVNATVAISPGVQVGYAITSPAAKTYQFRWTGDSSVAADGFQEFYGSVWTAGTFTSLTPGCTTDACPLEDDDFVSPVEAVSGGQRVDWDTFASSGWDGFSFTTDTEPVYFDVYVDGGRHPELVQFSSTAADAPSSPAESPFGTATAP